MTRAVTSKSESPPELFFAFPDGVYDYKCAECTALCCKGHGFGGSLDREMRSLFERYPQIESMAYSRSGDQITFATTASGCVVLDTDNLCRIEKDLGKGAKPNICNLFPFNLFAKIGTTIVVMPHFLCPLRAVVPARPGEVQGTHTLISDAIRNSRMLDRAYVKNMIAAARLHPAVTNAAVIDREKSFRNHCARALGANRFIDTLKKASTDPPALAAFIKRARGILGYESSPKREQRDALDDMLLAVASPYRIGLLELPAEGILRALAIAEIIVRRAWRGASQQPSFQGLANHIATFKPVQVLLAFADEAFDFGKVTQKMLSFRDAELTFAAFIVVHNAAEIGVLGALEQALPLNMSVSDRSILLMRLGEVLQRTKSKRSRKHGAVVDKIISSQENGLETESIVSGVS
jgi:hypothetical protein